MVSEARKQSIKTYRQEKRDQLAVDVPKGKRELYKAIAKENGLSLSMLIQNSVESFAGLNLSVKPAPIEKISAEERRLLDEFNKLPPDVQKSIAKMIRAINAELERDKIIAGK